MSQLLKQRLFQQSRRLPLLQFQRHRGKINIQRPQKPHYERARVMAVTQPRYPEPPKNLDCFERRTRQVVENPYNDIIAREVLNWLRHSRLVAIFHLNSIKSDDLFEVRVKLHKQNMHLKDYGQRIISKAVEGTRFEAIVPLFDANHCIVFSPEQPVAELLRITRRVPQMMLLAGIVDDTLLSRSEMMSYAQLPNLQEARAELVHTLNSAGSSIVRNLETHQNNFVHVLDIYAKGEMAASGETGKEETMETSSS